MRQLSFQSKPRIFSRSGETKPNKPNCNGIGILNKIPRCVIRSNLTPPPLSVIFPREGGGLGGWDYKLSVFGEFSSAWFERRRDKLHCGARNKKWEILASAYSCWRSFYKMFAARKIEREGGTCACVAYNGVARAHIFLDSCFLFKLPAVARRFRRVILFVVSGTNVGSTLDIIIY